MNYRSVLPPVSFLSSAFGSVLAAIDTQLHCLWINPVPQSNMECDFIAKMGWSGHKTASNIRILYMMMPSTSIPYMRKCLMYWLLWQYWATCSLKYFWSMSLCSILQGKISTHRVSCLHSDNPILGIICKPCVCSYVWALHLCVFTQFREIVLD